MRVSSLGAAVSRGAVSLLVLGSAGVLTACYVVPVNQAPGYVPPPAVVAAPMPLTFPARLYPANDQAKSYGMVSAIVTNDLNGRGTFSTAIGGESFSGEATRSTTSARDGIANGAGSRGSYLQCTYTMNSPTLGTGSCRLSNGAMFTMHVGN